MRQKREHFKGVPVCCADCKHLDKNNWFVCAAYPNFIPIPIQSGDLSHFNELHGDNGIQFEPSVEFLQTLLDAGFPLEYLMNDDDLYVE